MQEKTCLKNQKYEYPRGLRMPPIGGSVLLIQDVRWFESNFIYPGPSPHARVAQLVERGSYDNYKIAQGRGFKPRLEHPFF